MEFKTVGRDRLARELLKLGPISASDLADSLGISAVAVRKHLDDMSDKGLIESHEVAPFGPAKPKGRGRPAKVYALTSQGKDGVREFAKNRAKIVYENYSKQIEKHKTIDKKVEALTHVLSKEGFAATFDKGAGPTHTIQLCQHNCPIAHVAETHNEFCEAELETFSELLGVNVTRLSTIANGGNICTSLVSTLPKTVVTSAKQYKENI